MLSIYGNILCQKYNGNHLIKELIKNYLTGFNYMYLISIMRMSINAYEILCHSKHLHTTMCTLY